MKKNPSQAKKQSKKVELIPFEKIVEICKDATPSELNFTFKHTGKMKGMISLSTSNQFNIVCCCRNACVGSVCNKCYAVAQTKRYIDQENGLRKNWFILTQKLWSKNDMPFVNARFVRLEAFGDLNNWIQAANYFALCERNPHARFVLWTKNPNYILKAIEKGYKKPKNLYIILSSYKLNQVDKIKYNFVDSVFTVYDKKTVKAEGININCGARSCVGCMRCYSLVHGETVYTNEQLK